jgi:small GTP-binding protein
MNNISALEQLQELLLANDRDAVQRLRDELAELNFDVTDSKSDISQLKKLLDELHENWEDPDRLGNRLDPLLNLKIQEIKSNFSQLFGYEIRNTVKQGIRNSKDEFVDAIYPIVGKMIRKYVRTQFDTFLDDVGARLESGLSPKWWINRIKGLFGGVSKSELLLRESISYKLEEVFFIQHNSGLLLAAYSRNNTIDLDMIAGMLTAIKSFVGDAFAQKNEQDDDLESISYGSYKVMLTNFHSYYAASVVSGIMNNTQKEQLEDHLVSFAEQHIPSDISDVTNHLYEDLSVRLKEDFDNKKLTTIPTMQSVSKKIILSGRFCVGKTSLISRFVYQRFAFTYQTTLGVRIDRKTVQLDNLSMNMIIWDVGGEQTQSRIPDSYYLGSSGVIYVFDTTSPDSFLQITDDLTYIKNKLPQVPIITVGNKVDLLDEATLAEMKKMLPITADFYASALDGTNVENIFLKLAESIINVN